MKQRQTGTHPSHLLSEYAGTYIHPAFGSIIISYNNLQLSVTYFQTFENYVLTHWQYDVFAIVQFQSALFFNFHTDDITGKLTKVGIPFEPSVDPLLFIRQ